MNDNIRDESRSDLSNPKKRLQIIYASHCTFSSRAYVVSRKNGRKASPITNLNSKLVRAYVQQILHLEF